ncbi:MAG: ribbon-helix-helix protein, CopG family [Caldimicrobium sp.]|nr:ribbon-helix-helix protein, CopG family [Caldimicrobium sp.]
MTKKTVCVISFSKKIKGEKMMQWSIKNERAYKEVINVRLPHQAKKELKKIAKKRKMSLSDLVRLCIEKFLTEEVYKQKQK